ncbi:MAG: hypothetical protein PHS14_09745, partial [Elusimicrobia bacterium]|nr:hypothetical protein [Elusimicrobiota bacterium]
MGYKLEKMMGASKSVELLALVISWLFVSLFLFSSVVTTPRTYVAWIALASGISLISLDWIGFFEVHVPKPKLCGLVCLLLALPFSAFFAKWVLMAASLEPRIGNSEALCAALLAAAVFGSAQMLIFRVHRAMGAQWTLLTRLHPDDSRALHAQLEVAETSGLIRVQPLEAAYANGNGRGGREALVISRRSVHDLQDCSELISAHLGGQNIVDFRQLLKELQGRVDLNNADGWTFLLTSTPQIFHIRLYFYLKTVVEPLLALALGVLLLPFLLVMAIAVLWTSG